jgi:hypothetical protein
VSPPPRRSNGAESGGRKLAGKKATRVFWRRRGGLSGAGARGCCRSPRVCAGVSGERCAREGRGARVSHHSQLSAEFFPENELHLRKGRQHPTTGHAPQHSR